MIFRNLLYQLYQCKINASSMIRVATDWRQTFFLKQILKMLKFVSSRDKVPQWEYQNSYNMLFLSSTKRSGSKPNQAKPDQTKWSRVNALSTVKFTLSRGYSLFRFHRITYCLLINLWALTFLKTNVHFFKKKSWSLSISLLFNEQCSYFAVKDLSLLSGGHWFWPILFYLL